MSSLNQQAMAPVNEGTSPNLRRLYRLSEFKSSQWLKYNARLAAALRLSAMPQGARLMPLVSVIVPSHNRVNELYYAVTSVLRQTYMRLELLVIDDGSTDGTLEMLRSSFSDSRLVYTRIPHSGVSFARNYGLQLSKGSIVGYLDSDNYWKADFLELMVSAMVGCDLDVAYSGLSISSNVKEPLVRGDIFLWEECFKKNYVDINCFMHRRRLTCDKAGLKISFDAKLRRLVDWDFVLGITLLSERTSYIPFLGVDYSTSASSRITDSIYTGPGELQEAIAYIQSKYAAFLHVPGASKVDAGMGLALQASSYSLASVPLD